MELVKFQYRRLQSGREKKACTANLFLLCRVFVVPPKHFHTPAACGHVICSIFMNTEDQHIRYMQRALQLAERGAGFVNPNPMVGAVIVKDNTVIGEGYHHAYGQAHAEIEAMRAATDSLQGATIYVSLEPCSHHGKTPPCAQALIEAGFGKVYVATTDPNPLVSGRGIAMLQAAGISVHTGLLEKEARFLNRAFIKYIQKKQPYVLLKSAISLDGKIATGSGHSRWVSGQQSRAYVHQLRHRLSAVMIGIDTLLADDPQLNIRHHNTAVKPPIKVVVDSRGRTPLDARAWHDGQLIIAMSEAAPLSQRQAYMAKGAQLIVAGKTKVNLRQLLQALGEKGIDSLLLEGGATLNASMLHAGLVDELITFVAPKIVGGSPAKDMIGNLYTLTMSEALPLYGTQLRMMGADVMIQSFTKQEICLQE